jgi:hypothetical protein
VAQLDKAMTVAKLKAARDRKKARAGKCEGRKSHAEAQSEVRAGLATNPTFTIVRLRASRSSDSPIAAAGRGRLIDGLRKAGVPEE